MTVPQMLALSLLIVGGTVALILGAAWVSAYAERHEHDAECEPMGRLDSWDRP